MSNTQASPVPGSTRTFGSVSVSLTDDLVTVVQPFEAGDLEVARAEVYARSFTYGAEPLDQFYSDTDEHQDAWVRLYARVVCSGN